MTHSPAAWSRDPRTQSARSEERHKKRRPRSTSSTARVLAEVDQCLLRLGADPSVLLRLLASTHEGDANDTQQTDNPHNDGALHKRARVRPKRHGAPPSWEKCYGRATERARFFPLRASIGADNEGEWTTMWDNLLGRLQGSLDRAQLVAKIGWRTGAVFRTETAGIGAVIRAQRRSGTGPSALLRVNAATHPDKVTLVDGTRRLTARELDGRADRLTAA